MYFGKANFTIFPGTLLISAVLPKAAGSPGQSFRAVFSARVYRQDMPSAEYLKNNSVKRILLISERISGDLRKILLNYRKAGIDIYLKNIYEEPKKIKVRKKIRRRNR